MSKPIKLKKTEIVPFGPGGFDHSVQCWMCDKDGAVYDSTYNCFIPCWKCQKKNRMISEEKTFIEKLKEWLN